MNEQKNTPRETPRASKIASYAVIMLLMIIIVIIIAAIADNREQVIEDSYKSQLETSTQTNINIQNQITALSNENYELKEKVKALEEKGNSYDAAADVAQKLDEVNNLVSKGEKSTAQEKFAEINKDTVPDILASYYEITSKAVNR